MPRYLRLYLLACIVLAFGYLALHAGEPLRLNIGDGWADASVLTSTSHASVPEMFYGAVGKLVGPHQIVVFRALALLFSALAAWLLFQYARRMWNDTVAIIAAALATTCVPWIMFADSIDRAPIMHAACFLALYGVVRVLETGARRHYIAILAGTFICLLAASDDWLFLPLGVLFTVYVKRGTLQEHMNWRVIAVCAAGALVAALLRSPFHSDPDSWRATLDQEVAATFATQVRRYAELLTPMVWVTLGWAVVRALRAPSVKAAIEDGTTWMLVAAVVVGCLPPPRPESAMLRTQLLLPLYALGSALLAERLFKNGRRLARALAVAWCVVAPLWGFWLVVSQPREVLDRDDVARANEYLAANDRNGFVMSNLLADGPILAAFGRHGWIALDDRDATTACNNMLWFFEATGTDYVHAVIFTTPASRFVDRSITQVTHHASPAVDGWPYFVETKVNNLIEAYDKKVLRNLEAVGAKRVLHLGNFDIYRIDRETTLETAARSLRVVHEIDFASAGAGAYQLLGWGFPLKSTDPNVTLSSIAGYGRCRNPIAATTQPAPNACTVVSTAKGLEVLDLGGVSAAELLMPIERACDQQLTIALGAPARIDVAFNGATVLSCDDPQWHASSVSVRVPREHVHPGLNIITLHDVQAEPKTVRPDVRSVTVEPICEPPR